MSLLPPTDADYRRVEQIGRLFISGAMLLHEMLSKHDTITFKNWANGLCDHPSLENGVATQSRLKWLWDALRTEPELAARFGTLPPAAAPWSGSKTRFKVFEPGEWFVIGLKREAAAELLRHPHRPPLEETVAVKTIDELFMKSGKSERLECCDCRADVTIRVGEVFSVAREADIMEISKDRITPGDQVVTVRVDSLNQAYTVSSRRLEQGRRSHGGRTYDHVVHVRAGKRTPLETIRQQVENGDWNIALAEPQSKTESTEPDRLL